ncbi:hypothetical protein [Nocardioides pakistanensis]
MSTKNPAHRPPDTPDEEIPARDVRAGMWVYDEDRDGYLAVVVARESPWSTGTVDLFFCNRRRGPRPKRWVVRADKILRVRRPA